MTVAAEREHAPLARELAHVRDLLEAFRTGEPASPPERERVDFEPAIDRLSRLFALSPFERHLLLLAAAGELAREI
jgi:hypothetical protein